MKKHAVRYAEFAEPVIRVMSEYGLLLNAQAKGGKVNTMAIGWGLLGVVWGKPIFAVLVRPSRHTYGLIEVSGEFTVNVLPPAMKDVVTYCGTVSGRDHDKFAEQGLTAVAGKTVATPIIDEAVIAYECRVVHKNDVIPAELTGEIRQGSYPKGDFHRLYYGEILRTLAVDDAAAKLK